MSANDAIFYGGAGAFSPGKFLQFGGSGIPFGALSAEHFAHIHVYMFWIDARPVLSVCVKYARILNLPAPRRITFMFSGRAIPTPPQSLHGQDSGMAFSLKDPDPNSFGCKLCFYSLYELLISGKIASVYYKKGPTETTKIFP